MTIMSSLIFSIGGNNVFNVGGDNVVDGDDNVCSSFMKIQHKIIS